MHHFQEVEPTVGEKLCRLWQNVDGDEGVLTGASRSGGIRGDLKHVVSAGHGPGSMSGSGPFSTAKGHPHMAPYPPHPMYFPYPHSMPHSLFPGASGSGDSRNRMGGMSAHPFFTHPPRLGYSSPTHPHLLPPPLHPMSGGGGGPYPRPGRPWWTVPPFPPPSHLHHHPHYSHDHPPPGGNIHEYNSVQEDNSSPCAAQIDPAASSGSESPSVPAKSVVPRTSSRNAYSQQRQSILKKQQLQKEQALKTGKKLDTNVRYTRSHLLPVALTNETDDLPKVTLLKKNIQLADTYSFASEESSELRGIKKKDEPKSDSKKGVK